MRRQSSGFQLRGSDLQHPGVVIRGRNLGEERVCRWASRLGGVPLEVSGRARGRSHPLPDQTEWPLRVRATAGGGAAACCRRRHHPTTDDAGCRNPCDAQRRSLRTRRRVIRWRQTRPSTRCAMLLLYSAVPLAFTYR